jgi:Arc/MetJ-type ribon-helix-helix transcriptional regulator
MKTPKIAVRIPREEISAMDILVRKMPGVFKDRSDFVRKAILELIKHYDDYEKSLKEMSPK